MLNPMSTMRVPLAAELRQGQSFVMASRLPRSLLVLFAALVVIAVIPSFSTPSLDLEVSVSDNRVAELAFESCCSNANEKLATLPAITNCMASCPVVAMSFEAGMVVLVAASNRLQVARWRSMSDREIKPALRPPKAGDHL